MSFIGQGRIGSGFIGRAFTRHIPIFKFPSVAELTGTEASVDMRSNSSTVELEEVPQATVELEEVPQAIVELEPNASEVAMQSQIGIVE